MHIPQRTALFHWFVNGEFQGTAHRGPTSKFPNAVPDALHFGCPYCGIVWAQSLPYEWPDDYPPLRHVFLQLPCDSCGMGSLAGQTGRLDSLPRKLLEREIEIACNAPDDYGTLAVFSRRKT